MFKPRNDDKDKKIKEMEKEIENLKEEVQRLTGIVNDIKFVIDVGRPLFKPEYASEIYGRRF